MLFIKSVLHPKSCVQLFGVSTFKEKNSFFDFLRTERVQETVRNLGYIDTKGKTKEQIAQEM